MACCTIWRGSKGPHSRVPHTRSLTPYARACANVASVTNDSGSKCEILSDCDRHGMSGGSSSANEAYLANINGQGLHSAGLHICGLGRKPSSSETVKATFVRLESPKPRPEADNFQGTVEEFRLHSFGFEFWCARCRHIRTL